METAESLADKICHGMTGDPSYSADVARVARFIEFDRAAVALAVLDEVRAQASLEAFNIPESNAIIRAVETVRNKHTQPGGVK